MDVGGSKLELLARLMNASSLRGRIIAGNISNQNTPGFKRREVAFEDELRTALEQRNVRSIQDLQPEVTVDDVTPGKPDGNNVNMEMEMNAMRENRLTYETYATILEGNLRLIDAAISEGR